MIIMKNELQQSGFAFFDISQIKQFIMKVILKASEAEILAHLTVKSPPFLSYHTRWA